MRERLGSLTAVVVLATVVASGCTPAGQRVVGARPADRASAPGPGPAGPTIPPASTASPAPSVTTPPHPSGHGSRHAHHAAPEPTDRTPEPSGRTRSGQRPNFVFITTDDQRTDDMRFMPYTRRLIGGHGVTFTHGLSPHPLCCPARAEWMTGQYGQNNGVHHNRGAHGGYRALRQPHNTLAAWLARAGYQTAMAGKYLNGYEHVARAEPGWTHWNPSVGGVYSYVRTTFWNDGVPEDRTGDNVDDAVVGYTRDYIEEFARRDAPFFVWASHLSPHEASAPGGHWVPPVPAPRHAGLFPGARNPAARKPSFGTPVRHGVDSPMTGDELAAMPAENLARIRSLQAVDEGVRSIVATLRRTGELDHTYLVFVSDNGYLLGEHLLRGKNFLYDEALRVPFLVRVPGRGRPRSSPVPVTMVDIAPTILELAEAKPGRTVDGVSFARLLATGRQEWRDTQLVQTGTAARGTHGWDIRGVRTARWTYGVRLRDGREQLYDRRRDPFELVNLAGRPAYRPVVAALRVRLRALEECAGAACAASFGPVPPPVHVRG